MCSGHTQTLIGIVGGQVCIVAAPASSTQFQGTEHVVVTVEDIEHDLTFIGQTGFLFLYA